MRAARRERTPGVAVGHHPILQRPSARAVRVAGGGCVADLLPCPAVSILSRLPLHPVLLAAFAVLSVYAENLTEVLPVDLGGPFGPLARAVIGAAITLLLCGLVMRDWRRGAILATAVVAAYAFFGRLAPELLGIGLSEQLQLAAWALVVVAAGVFAIRVRGALPSATLALNAFTLILFGHDPVQHRALRVAPGRGPGHSDAGCRDTHHGHQGAKQGHLSHRARSIRPWTGPSDTGSVSPITTCRRGWATRASRRCPVRGRTTGQRTSRLSSMLSMQMLDEYSVDPGRDSGDRTYARSRLLRPAAAAFLQDNGYAYYQLGSWYGPTQTNELADVTLSWEHDTEFESVLRQSTMLPAIDRLLGRTTGEGDEFRDNARARAEFQFRQLQRLPSVPGRKFVFAHILLPHPPYVFDANGNMVVKATAEVQPEAELYANQLAFANSQVKQTVDALLAGPPESDPIIIIMGDEGPFLCRNVDCVDPSVRRPGIRFGVLAAYYLPDQPAGFFPPDHTHVNTFRMLFDAYFGTDLPAA